MADREIAFDFITDEALRAGLEADYRELKVCAEHGAWKAVHVLAGSIVEAILVEHLVGSGQTSPDPRTMTLAQLIAASKKAGVLSRKTAELSGALKEYRNLIHPGRAARLGETADADGAVVARALVSMIVGEVAATQQETYGFTAEQIVSKFENDPSALGIAEHLLRDAPDQEVERLLLKVLPERYFEELEAEEPDESLLQNHVKLYRAALEGAPDALKKKAMSKYVTVLKEESGLRVQVYEEQFFRARDLAHLAAGDKELVKEHLFARLKAEPSKALIEVTSGIGPHLTQKNATRFVDALVRPIVYPQQMNLGSSAREVLEREALHTPTSVDPKIIRRLDDWIKMFEHRDDAPRAAMVSAVKQAYEAVQIPE